jgi:hypothetical protein
MNIHKFSLAIVFACLLLNSLIPNQPVYAEGASFVEIPLQTLHDAKPIQLQGLISSQTVNIPIPQSWLVNEGNWLEIKILTSPLLDPARSSITISLNNLQIFSFNLTSIPREKRKILIPANMLTQGNNTLTFTGALYLPDDSQTNCQNWDDPSRWASIDPSGVIHLSFAKHDTQVDLANFPEGLVEPLENYLPEKTKKSTLIVLPEKSTQDDLTSLSTISYELGNRAGADTDWQPEVVNGSQLNSTLVANRNIIFVGTVPTEFQDKVGKDKDYLALFPSPWGTGNAVLIIGDQNRTDGFTPASVLSNRTKSLLLRGNVAYLNRDPLPEPQPFPKDVSLEELGYLDRTVKGIGQQNLIYNLYIPYNVEPTSVKLSLGLVHSADLDVLNSSFTVYLNGFSVAGILPSGQNSTAEPISIGLPAKKFRPGINFIRVGFNLHVPHSSCERALDTVWATVLNSSILHMTYRNHTPMPTLKNFPLPFSDYPGVTYVVPDHYDEKDLNYVSRLSFMLGSSSYQASDPPELMTADSFNRNKASSPNVILVGLPLENSAIRSANDLLPQPFATNKNSLQDGYGVFLPTSNIEATLGLMQIMPSPWVKGGTVLVLSGNNRQGLDWAWDVVLNPSLQSSFAGNVMVVGATNRTASLGAASAAGNPQALFQQVADASNIPIVGSLLQKSGQAFVGPVLIAVGAALLLVIAVLWAIGVVAKRKVTNALEKTKEDEDEAR